MVYDEEQDMHVMLPFAEAMHATCYGSSPDLAEADVFGITKLTAALVNKMLAHAEAIGADAATAAMALTTLFVRCGAPLTLVGAERGVRAERTATSSGSEPGLASFRSGAARSSGFGSLGRTDGDEDAGAYEAPDGRVVDAKIDDKDGATAARKARCADVATAIAFAVAAGVWVPVEIVIARPFIQHLMLSAIVAVAGSKTGATLFGPADSAPPASMHCTHTHTHTHRPHTPPTHRPHTAHTPPTFDAHKCALLRSATVGQHVCQDHRGCVACSLAHAHASQPCTLSLC
jgi:hypothetical protein